MVAIEVYDCWRRAHTIAAIKYVRLLREINLAEAKFLIDEVYFGNRSVRHEFTAEEEAREFSIQMESFGFCCRNVISTA